MIGIFKKADLVLLHPPSVYDFRKMLSVPSPIADLIPSTSIFEMYPIGFSFLGEYLERHGFHVRVVNLATRMLEKPGFDAEKLLSRMEPQAFGIGFHWLPHCHGAIEIARICKKLHPRIPVIFGGYSASIFHRELLDYPEIDYVVRGDSTEEPLRLLLEALRGEVDRCEVPNLSYRKSETGQVVENGLSYVPSSLDHLGNNYLYMMRSAIKYRDIRSLRAFGNWWSYPLSAVLTCRGCSRDCSFCGGSSQSMKDCFHRGSVAFRRPERIADDVVTISKFTGAPIFIIGDLLQAGESYAREVLNALGRKRPRNHIVLELFEPAPEWFFGAVSKSLPRFDFEISPESHDEKVRLACGKDYSNNELQQNIRWALDCGCSKFDAFFMIGLPHQDQQSVMQTVKFCAELMEKFGPVINPLIGPLAPFIDPGCSFYSNPEQHGYTLFFQELEDYRKALSNPHWRDILSYETKWMSRQEIVDSTYAALLELNKLKGAAGLAPSELTSGMDRFLRESMLLLDRFDAALKESDPTKRKAELDEIKEKSDALNSMTGLVREQLKWPIVGRKFHYLSILAMLKTQRHETYKVI